MPIAHFLFFYVYLRRGTTGHLGTDGTANVGNLANPLIGQPLISFNDNSIMIEAVSAGVDTTCVVR